MTDAAETYFNGAAELQPRPITEPQWADAVEAYQRAKLMKDAVAAGARDEHLNAVSQHNQVGRSTNDRARTTRRSR